MTRESRESSSNVLRKKAVDLLKNALAEIRRERTKTAAQKEARFRVAEFLLCEALEYVEASCEALEADRPRAALATSRWLLEAALNLFWVTAEPSELDERLKLLAAEAIRLEAARAEGLSELYPAQAEQYKRDAAAKRLELKNLIGQKKSQLKSLDNRMKSIQLDRQSKALPNVYSLYRVCCGAAHPGLEFSRRFNSAPGGVTVTSPPPDQMAIARFISIASTLWLVSAAYHLTDLGDAESLNRWWKEQIVSLLD